MREHWEFFPCQMGDDVAFIFYDHGINESINSHAANQRLRIELTYKTPADNGLPTTDEFDAAKDIEDDIAQYIQKSGGLYVGRITVASRRYFYCYIELPETDIARFVETLTQRYSYGLTYTVIEDPMKSGYWNDLFPTEDDWQMIQDSKVVEELRKHGDPIDQVRRIDHWAYFKSRRDADQFSARVKAEGFAVESISDPETGSPEFSVQFHRLDLPELYQINRITFRIRSLVQEHDGQYDGWETSVEKGVPNLQVQRTCR